MPRKFNFTTDPPSDPAESVEPTASADPADPPYDTTDTHKARIITFLEDLVEGLKTNTCYLRDGQLSVTNPTLAHDSLSARPAVFSQETVFDLSLEVVAQQNAIFRHVP